LGTMAGMNANDVQEKMKDAQKKIVEFWKKYDRKQKALIISIIAVVFVAIVILGMILTRKPYVELITCDDTLAAAEVKTALSDNGYDYKISNGGLTFKVLESELNDATYLIAQGGYTASGYDSTSIDDALGGGFSTTSEDKQRLYQKYLEDKMKGVLEGLDYVQSARVTFSIPEDSLSILAEEEEASVAVTLKLRSTLPDDAGISIANYIAAAVGNKTTDNIIIIDTQGNTIFQGDQENEVNGMSASYREKILALYENIVTDNITKLIARIPVYQSVAVSPILDIDFTQVDIEEIIYSNPDGVLDSEYIYEATGGSITGGIPGTDLNDDDTSYYIGTTDGATTEVIINKNDFAVSSTITHETGVRGTIDYDTSSVAIVLTQYVVYNEDEVRLSGQLEEMTWEEFKLANGASIPIDVDEDMVALLKAGCMIDNLEVLAYQVPMFNDTEAEERTLTDYLPIILAVVILAMLAFVVWKSLKPVEVTEVDASISVDDLLTATQESQVVEEIDLNEKSEVRRAIEKFVDENPEAVALLLRNWLNDDWD